MEIGNVRFGWVKFGVFELRKEEGRLKRLKGYKGNRRDRTGKASRPYKEERNGSVETAGGISSTWLRV